MARAETLYGNPLYLTRSNNLPSNIAKYYLETVIACNSCPMDLVTDRGTESGVMAGIHSSFCMIQTVTDMGLLHGINALKFGGPS